MIHILWGYFCRIKLFMSMERNILVIASVFLLVTSCKEDLNEDEMLLVGRWTPQEISFFDYDEINDVIFWTTLAGDDCQGILDSWASPTKLSLDFDFSSDFNVIVNDLCGGSQQVSGSFSASKNVLRIKSGGDSEFVFWYTFTDDNHVEFQSLSSKSGNTGQLISLQRE